MISWIKKSVRKCPYARKPVKVRKIRTTYGKSVRVGTYGFGCYGMFAHNIKHVGFSVSESIENEVQFLSSTITLILFLYFGQIARTFYFQDIK